MTKIRTFKKFTLIYNMEKNADGYTVSIMKESVDGTETSAYTVWGDETELKALLCRMWGCSVTPMSLRYILQDEGFLPQIIEDDSIKRIPAAIVKRQPVKEIKNKELVLALTGKE
ncbi:MAG: hypothetical protein E7597_04080 [Ruminococcaceae bacterium]|nr:hypothetical protein [Oscillospiraceae bacterium]